MQPTVRNLGALLARHPQGYGQAARDVRAMKVSLASQKRAHLWFAAVLGMGAPGTAFAHGEDVLGTIFAQGLVLILVIVVSACWSARLSRKLFVMGGALIGIAASWVATSGMPYRSNALIITIVHVLLPLIGAALCVGVATLAARGKDSDPQCSQRPPEP